nr:MAG TPA: Cation-transporting ATPase [Caudoviricetes sp.]
MRHQGMVAGFSFPIVQVPYDPDAPAAGRRTATAKRCANCGGPLPKFKKKFCCQECLDAAYARKAERGHFA